ncbi:MAG: cysteate synthase [Deltaproteobacteria bacterium HGW-Deltaproteobacteria-13]|jgi:cysteate synthase|nr:MAG: cysteate synthase [Deltaproteobacteria bacterium HGW-Deltaproteobacteria-13]
MIKEQPIKYVLRCRQCGTELADDGLVLFHKGCDPPGLLQTVYTSAWPGQGDDGMGIFQYHEWLPIRRTLPGSSAPVTYRSRGLAEQLRLENLFIAFSGYWPERGALMRTCTFKELEAYAVCARLPERFEDVLVIASAGNTARAFIHVCSTHHIRALIVVPEWSIPMLWRETEHNDCVRIIAVGGNSDYADAVLLADSICRMDGFVAEGGARNVARRDGLGTTVLSCAEEAGCIPDEYFQAVGSGTGAIAAWEASERLSLNKVWPGGPMRLHVAQNLPLAPIYESWTSHSSRIVSMNSLPGCSSEEMYAGVLYNRRPPYGVAGGLYDALLATNGHAYGIANEEAGAASKLFEEAEGIDIDPAAAVAVAGLVKCVARKTVEKDAYIMLNITGGGFKRLRRDVELQTTMPIAVVDRSDFKSVRDHLICKRS